MDSHNRIIKIKWNIFDLVDVYYEATIYQYGGFEQFSTKKKQSKLCVYSKHDLVHRQYLNESDQDHLLFALENIRSKFTDSDVLLRHMPSIPFRLRIKSPHFNLDYKWTDEGIAGNNSLFQTLSYVIETLSDLYPLNLNQLGVEPLE